jgi:hypothetical protein
MFGDAREHSGANLFSVVKGEDEVREAVSDEDAVRATLAVHPPPNANERS